MSCSRYPQIFINKKRLSYAQGVDNVDKHLISFVVGKLYFEKCKNLGLDKLT